MALRSAWWMYPRDYDDSSPATLKSSHTPDQLPHQTWPSNQATSGIAFGELDKFLQANKRPRCSVEKFIYAAGASSRGRPLWKHTSSVNSVNSLIDLVETQDTEQVRSTFFVLRDACSEAVQVLGYHLDVTPRFFNIGFTIASTGNTVDEYAFFGLQIIEKYLPTAVPATGRGQPVPHVALGNHEWHMTMIAALFKMDGDRYTGIVHFQATDQALADGMKILMTRDEEHFMSEGEECAGQGQILAEIMYIVRYQWEAFLREADAHLQGLSKRCVEGELTPTEQLKYMRDLHQLLPTWVASRRRIVAARDLNRNMCLHPFFRKNKMDGSFTHYLEKCNMILDECLTRCDALTAQTQNIINLIFNIATLQDTRASVEHSMAANASAASIRRVTLLTFIYLPLTLVASMYGMNVREVSPASDGPRIWTYFASSLSVLVVTLLAWMIWSKFENRAELKTTSQDERVGECQSCRSVSQECEVKGV